VQNRRSDLVIGQEIRRLRGKKSQAAFAELLGLKAPGGQTQVSGWEGGSRASDETLEKIAGLAGVPISLFYEEEVTSDRPLTTQEVVRLRDQVREMKARTDEVLAVLEEALSMAGAPVLPVGDADELIDRSKERGNTVR